MPTEIRLLACTVCKTIEEIPDFEGRPEEDHLLNRLVEGHGPRENRHLGSLFRVDKDQWQSASVRSEITKRIAATLSGGETGLGSEYYDLKNTFVADAMSCFKAHQRNPACNDYKSDSKRLTPDTAAERREVGLSAYRTEHDRYLCDFCPVHSLVEQAARAKAGLYK